MEVCILEATRRTCNFRSRLRATSSTTISSVLSPLALRFPCSPLLLLAAFRGLFFTCFFLISLQVKYLFCVQPLIAAQQFYGQLISYNLGSFAAIRAGKIDIIALTIASSQAACEDFETKVKVKFKKAINRRH